MQGSTDINAGTPVASDEKHLGELDESGAKSTNVAHDSSTLETHSGAKDLMKSTSDLTKYETVTRDEASPARPEPPKEPGQPPEPGSVQVIQRAYKEMVRFQQGGQIGFSRVSARSSSWASPGEAREGVCIVQF